MAPDRLIDRIRHRFTGGDQHRDRVIVVLGLSEEVGAHQLGVGRVVGDDQDLARTGQTIDPDLPVEVLLGGGDPAIAGPDHEVAGWGEVPKARAAIA